MLTNKIVVVFGLCSALCLIEQRFILRDKRKSLQFILNSYSIIEIRIFLAFVSELLF